jgi:hypothetical protein
MPLNNSSASSSEEGEMPYISFLDCRVMMAMRLDTQQTLSSVIPTRTSTSLQPKNCPDLPRERAHATRLFALGGEAAGEDEELSSGLISSLFMI